MFESQNLSSSKGEQLNTIIDSILEKSGEVVSTQDDKLLLLAQEAPQALYLRRLYQQAKQLSQMICYIWRWIDGQDPDNQDVAQNLQRYFLEPTETRPNGGIEIGGNLKKLLGANPKAKNPNQEDLLLRKVFPDYDESENLLFPLFSEFELGNRPGAQNLGYLFLIDVNVFDGALEDVDSNTPTFFKFVIPYPPRPQLGEGTVTSARLEEWVGNRRPNEIFPNNPYIPKTCS